jgi:hypothetical protein
VTVLVGSREPAQTYRVFDAAGQVVLQGRVAMGGRFDLPVQHLQPGMYLVQVQGEGRIGTIRFVKE